MKKKKTKKNITKHATKNFNLIESALEIEKKKKKKKKKKSLTKSNQID